MVKVINQNSFMTPVTMGAAVSSVQYNLKPRHPTLDMPIIDYDLAVLIHPMLMLGISIGVTFNVIFADWMVTVLLLILFIGTSTKAFLRGVETWKNETILKKEVSQRLAANGSGAQGDYKLLPSGPSNATQNDTKASENKEVSIIENVCWTEFGLLCFVWVAFLTLQIIKQQVFLLNRFVRFVSTPEILERLHTIESEIIQIEEAITIQGNKSTAYVNEEKAIGFNKSTLRCILLKSTQVDVVYANLKLHFCIGLKGPVRINFLNQT